MGKASSEPGSHSQSGLVGRARARAPLLAALTSRSLVVPPIVVRRRGGIVPYGGALPSGGGGEAGAVRLRRLVSRGRHRVLGEAVRLALEERGKSAGAHFVAGVLRSWGKRRRRAEGSGRATLGEVSRGEGMPTGARGGSWARAFDTRPGPLRLRRRVNSSGSGEHSQTSSYQRRAAPKSSRQTATRGRGRRTAQQRRRANQAEKKGPSRDLGAAALRRAAVVLYRSRERRRGAGAGRSRARRLGRQRSRRQHLGSLKP